MLFLPAAGMFGERYRQDVERFAYDYRTGDPVDLKDRVFQEPAVVAPWLRAHGRRLFVALAFLLVHAAGLLYTFTTLREVWQSRLLLQLLLQRTFLYGLVRIPPTALTAGFGLIAILALVEIARILRRLRRGEPEPDVALRWRGLVYVSLLCVLFNAFVLSTPESFLGPFRVRHPIHAQISLAYAYGGYVAWSLLLPWLRRKVPQRVRRGLDLLGMNAALVLVLAEISLRVLAAVFPSPLLMTDSAPSQMRRAAGRRPPGWMLFNFPMNSRSHYDSEFAPPSPDRDTVVVNIGDSFSYGTVPHAYHFTTVAEQESPGFQFYNMGYPGIGPTDYVYLLQHEARPLQPAMYVVQLFVGNDITDGAAIGGPSRWFDADSYRFAVVLHRLGIMRRARQIGQTTAEEAQQTTAELAVRYPWLADPTRERPHMDGEVFNQLELRNALAVLPAGTAVYQRLFRSLAVMKNLAGDIPIAFVLIPDEFQVEDDLWQEVRRRAGRDLDRDRPQRLMSEWLRSEGLPFVDLLPLLRAVPPLPDGRRHVYHLHDTHFNARGNEVAGKALARMVDSLLSPEAMRDRGRRPAPSAAPPMPTVSLPLRVDVGDSSAWRWMRSGWQSDETGGGQSYAWSDGTASELHIALPTGRDIQLGFDVLPFSYRGSPRQAVTVVLNGTEVETVRLDPELKHYSVVLPAAALKVPVSTLQFRYAWSRSPQAATGSADARELAVAWFSIDFAAVNP